MRLSVFERATLFNILQGIVGNFTTLKTLRELREAVGFSEKENKELQFKQEGAKIIWRADKARDKDIPITDGAKKIIVTRLKELNKQKQLQDDHYSLYEKFVQPKKVPRKQKKRRKE